MASRRQKPHPEYVNNLKLALDQDLFLPVVCYDDAKALADAHHLAYKWGVKYQPESFTLLTPFHHRIEPTNELMLREPTYQRDPRAYPYTLILSFRPLVTYGEPHRSAGESRPVPSDLRRAMKDEPVDTDGFSVDHTKDLASLLKELPE